MIFSGWDAQGLPWARGGLGQNMRYKGKKIFYLPAHLFIYILQGPAFFLVLLPERNQIIHLNMAFFKEFKEFAMKGNVVDMAVGVIIGAAFGKIVSSLVDDIIMPLVGVATGGMNFTDFKWVIQKGVTEGETIIQPEVTMNYGAWIQTIVDFIIVALCIFVMIKFINNMRKDKAAAEEAVTEAAAEPTKEEQLLTEIRDILKKDQQ